MKDGPGRPSLVGFAADCSRALTDQWAAARQARGRNSGMSRFAGLLLSVFVAVARSENVELAEPAESKVKVVDYQHFQEFVSTHSLTLIQFYAPWNGHSRSLASKYRQAASALADANLSRPVVLAKYDDSTEEQRKLRAGAPDVFNFHSYPALVVFENGKPHRYAGGIESDDIISYMTAISNGQTLSSIQKSGLGLFESMPNYEEDILRELNEESFESYVLKEKNVGAPL